MKLNTVERKIRNQVRTINREQLAWSAGFFDGEGSIFAHAHNGQKRWVIRITIAQVHREVLERMQTALGMGTISGPFGPYPSSRNRISKLGQYRYTICGGERVQAAIAFMWPWLGTVKREQSKQAFHNWRKTLHGCIS